MERIKKQKTGFTLIELLIVVMIIGILAGVTIGLVNPTVQRNRAKDGVTKSAMTKMALATDAYVSAFGEVPLEAMFLKALAPTATEYASYCSDGNNGTCLFSVSGVALPQKCTANSGSQFRGGSSDTSQCYFLYYNSFDGDATTPDYGFWAMSWGIKTTLFRYMSNTVSTSSYAANNGKIFHCTGTTAASSGSCAAAE